VTVRPEIITVASGKGGGGKSSICVNLAIALSQLGKKVLIVDADFGLANIDVMLGVQARYSLAHYLRGDFKLDEIVQIGYDGVRFISGGSGYGDLLHITEDQIDALMDDLKHTSLPVDYIICDAGAGIGESVLRVIKNSDSTIIIATPEPTAVTDAFALLRVITAQYPSVPVSVIVNRVTSVRDAINITDRFFDMIETTLEREVKLTGFVLEDAEVSKSIRNQTPIMVTSPDAKFSRDIRSIAREMLGLPPLKQPVGVFARLVQRIAGAVLDYDSPESRDESDYERLLARNPQIQKPARRDEPPAGSVSRNQNVRSTTKSESTLTDMSEIVNILTPTSENTTVIPPPAEPISTVQPAEETAPPDTASSQQPNDQDDRDKLWREELNASRARNSGAFWEIIESMSDEEDEL